MSTSYIIVFDTRGVAKGHLSLEERLFRRNKDHVPPPTSILCLILPLHPTLIWINQLSFPLSLLLAS